MRFVKNKKADVPAMIATYVLAAVLFGLIMVFGYNAVVTIRASGDQVSLVQLKTGVEGAVHKMSLETGRSIEPYEFLSPGGFTQICFLSSDYIRKTPAENMLTKLNTLKTKSSCKDKNIIIDSANSGATKNMFLFPGTTSFDIGRIEVDNGCQCMEILSGKITFRLQGKGNSAKVLDAAS